MANHKSAKKRIIRNANRAEINKSRISRIRTHLKNVELAVASGDKDAARTALQAAQPELRARQHAACAKFEEFAAAAALAQFPAPALQLIRQLRNTPPLAGFSGEG